MTLCPILTGDRHSCEQIAVREGSTINLIFYLEWPDKKSKSDPFYTIGFNSSNITFWEFHKKSEDGFKSRSQQQRFEITDTRETALSLFVNLTILDVCFEDEDVYVLTLIVNYDLVEYITTISQKEINILTPPEKATCYIALSNNWVDHSHEVRCKAKSTSGFGNLKCFQDDIHLNATSGISYDGIFLRGIFWMKSRSPLSCCSYAPTDIVTLDTCRDFMWPFHNDENISPSLRPKTNIPNTSERGSGSCRQYELSWGNLFIASWFLFIAFDNIISV